MCMIYLGGSFRVCGVKLRRASCTHCIDLASLAELIHERHMQPEYVYSEDQSADALAKVIQPILWDRLLHNY